MRPLRLPVLIRLQQNLALSRPELLAGLPPNFTHILLFSLMRPRLLPKSPHIPLLSYKVTKLTWATKHYNEQGRDPVKRQYRTTETYTLRSGCSTHMGNCLHRAQQENTLQLALQGNLTNKSSLERVTHLLIKLAILSMQRFNGSFKTKSL